MSKVLLLTGQPGSGKTTIVKQALASTRIKAGGFYTGEIRTTAGRQGFNITTLDGNNAILAHVNVKSSMRVGKYGVDVNNIDITGVTAIRKALKVSDVIVIDEIGKMELFSVDFKKAVLEAITSGKKVLGTIMQKSYPFADEIKSRSEVKVIEVSRTNRDIVLKQVTDWLNSNANENKTASCR